MAHASSSHKCIIDLGKNIEPWTLSGERFEIVVMLTVFYLGIWWNLKFTVLYILQNSLPVSYLTNLKLEFLKPTLHFRHGYFTMNPC